MCRKCGNNSCDNSYDSCDQRCPLIEAGTVEAKRIETKRIEARKINALTVRSKKIKTKSLKVKDDLVIPTVNIDNTEPSPGSLAIDNDTKQLFYSEGTRWNLAGTWQGSRDIIVDLNGEGDFTSVQKAVNSLRSTVLEGPVNIRIKPGVYEEEGFNIIDVNQFLSESLVNLIGDKREIVAQSFTHGIDAEIKLEENTITIISSIDLTTQNLVKGDKIFISRTSPEFTAVIDEVISENTIKLENLLPPPILNLSEKLGTSVTFVPNVTITSEITASYSSIIIEGVNFVGHASLDNSIIRFDNAIINSSGSSFTEIQRSSEVFLIGCTLFNRVIVGFQGSLNSCSFKMSFTAIIGNGFQSNGISTLDLQASNIIWGTFFAGDGVSNTGFINLSILPLRQAVFISYSNIPRMSYIIYNGNGDSNIPLVRIEGSTCLIRSVEFRNVQEDANFFLVRDSSSLIVNDILYTNLQGPPKIVYSAINNSYIQSTTPQGDLPAATEAAYQAINFSSIRATDNPNDRFPGPVITEVESKVAP